jgi:hypothetical protein
MNYDHARPARMSIEANIGTFQFVTLIFRTASLPPPTNLRRTMEASMRTMSWSRYHTFTRIRTHLHSRSAKRLRRAAKGAIRAAIQASIQASADRTEPECQSGDTPRGFSRGFLAGISQSLTRIFRAGRLRNRTDI